MVMATLLNVYGQDRPVSKSTNNFWEISSFLDPPPQVGPKLGKNTQKWIFIYFLLLSWPLLLVSFFTVRYHPSTYNISRARRELAHSAGHQK